MSICQPAMGPTWIPFKYNYPLYAGHDTLPLHGDTLSAMNISRRSHVSDCRLTLLPVLTDQTCTTCVVKEKLEKPSNKTFLDCFVFTGVSGNLVNNTESLFVC